MPNLFLLNWTNSNPTNTAQEYISYTSAFDIPQGGSGSFQNITGTFAPPSGYIITWNSSIQGYLKYNILYDFGVSAKCESTGAFSPTSTINNKIKWFTPDPLLLATPSNLGEWNYVSTDTTVSIWFDSTDLKYCRRIDIDITDMSGNPVSGASGSTFFISPITVNNDPTNFVDNLKNVYFTGLQPDTQYKVKLILTAQGTNGNTLSNSPVNYTVSTKPAGLYSQWIVIPSVSNNPADCCNIKNQIVVQADPLATAGTIQSGVEHLYTSYLAFQSLGPIGPLSPGTITHIRLFKGNYQQTLYNGDNRVYGYNGVNSHFDPPAQHICS